MMVQKTINVFILNKKMDNILMKDDNFEKIPPIPEEILKECLKEKSNLILFIGAGVSRLCGFPLWDELANKILEKCKDNKEIDNSEIEIVKRNYDSIGKITFANAILGNVEELICDELKKDNLKNDGILKKDKIIKYLNSFKSTIITTNADLILDELKDLSPDWEIITGLDNDSIEYVKNYPSIVHLHGSINSPGSLVFTLDQYASKYSYQRGFAPQLQDLLSNKLNKIILFIGYSLRDFQLLQYILDFDANGMVEKHIYKLDGYLASEKINIKVDNEYYDHLGIQLIPYSREIKGYDKLLDVLENWSNEINRQINIFQNPDIKTEQALKNAPDKQSIKYVLKALPLLTDESFFATNLVNSQYFDQWMVAVSQTVIFDTPSKFKPCIEFESKRYKSSIWPGLEIIESYIKKYGFNQFILDLTKKILKESAELLKHDSEIENIYQRRNTSFSIMYRLIEIMLSNKSYLEDVDVVKTIVESEAKSPFSDSQTFAYELSRFKDVLVDSNPDSVFILYKTALDNSHKSMDYSEYYKHDKMKDIIKKSPNNYFVLGKTNLLKRKDELYLMGAFYNYDNYELADTIKTVSSYYVKTASQFINESTLIDSINEMLDFDDERIKRIGLCLIGINFDRVNHIFKERLDEIFENDTYYSDLRILLSNNGERIAKDKELFRDIISRIDKLHYDNSEQRNATLKKGLFNSLKQFDVEDEIGYIPLDLNEAKDIDNYNKAVYSEPINFNQITNNIYDEIKDLTISEFILKIEQKYKDISTFYLSSFFNAVDSYLSTKHLNEYIDILRKIHKDYLNHFLFEMYYGKTIKLDHHETIQIINYLNDNEYKNNIDSIISVIDSDLKDEALSKEERLQLLKDFKYKYIDLEPYKEGIGVGDINANITHGNSFYRYFNLLVNEAITDTALHDFVIAVYQHFKDRYLNHPLFRFDIGIKYGELLSIDETLFKKEMALYYKNNPLNQFIGLAFTGNINQILDYIKDDETFKNYLSNKQFSGRFKSNLSLRIFFEYITNDNYGELIDCVVASLDINALESLLQSLWHYLNKETDEVKVLRLNNIIDKYIYEIKNNEEAELDIDRLMYVASELIALSSNSNKKIWELLVEVSSFKHDHLFKEFKEVIVKYSEEEKDNILKILSGFMESFEKYGANYYIRFFIEILNELYSGGYYKDICTTIKRRIVRLDLKTKNAFVY